MSYRENIHPDVLTLCRRVDKLARLMPGLPQFLEPLRLAETRETLSGELQADGMQRLGGLLHAKAGTVRFRLSFERNDRGFVCISGEFSTKLTLVCQRCLEPLETEVAGPIAVALIANLGDAERLSGDREPVLLHDHTIHLACFLEDEILLALPLAPTHAAGVCAATGTGSNTASLKANPFAALKVWKNKGPT